MPARTRATTAGVSVIFLDGHAKALTLQALYGLPDNSPASLSRLPVPETPDLDALWGAS